MSIQRISVSVSGVQGDGASYTGAAPTISLDNRFFVFESNASNLVSGDTNGTTDVFVYDRINNQISRASTTTSNTQATGTSFDGVINSGGRYVAFNTNDSSITGGSGFYVARKDLLTGEIKVAGPAYIQVVPENPHEPHLSADGRYVVYATNSNQVIRHDFLTNTDETVVVAQFSGTPAISQDGRYVAFFSRGSLVAGDEAAQGDGGYSDDVFLKDMSTGAITRISNSYVNLGQNPNNNSYNPEFSADGRYLIYSTNATDVVPGDSSTAFDIIRYEILTGATVRVSVPASGADAVGGESPYGMISGNGRYIAFESTATNLVNGDTNGLRDIFVKDMQSGSVIRISNAAGGSEANGASSNPTISADGRFVTFKSDATNLVGGDTNGTSDVFLVDLAESGFWQGVEKVGGNVQVNTQSAGSQSIPTTIALTDDRFLITWSDLSVQQVKGQFFDAAGTKTGSEFVIMGSSTTGFDTGALKLSNGNLLFFQGSTPNFGKIIGADGSVPTAFVEHPTGANGYYYTAALANGGFVISYSANGYVNIGVQAYDSAGLKVGAQFVVASGTFNEFVTKEVIAFGDGGYGLLYDQNSTGLLLQRFDANGATNGAATRISSSTADFSGHSQIDAISLADGRAFVAWSQGGFIHSRFLDSHGVEQGLDVILSPSSTSGQNWPHVIATTDGHIAVAWTAGGSLYSQMLAADGTAISQTTLLSTSVAIGWVVFPTALPNGGVLYTWRGQDGSNEGAEARMIDGSGAIASDEILLNTATTGYQYGEQAAVNSQGVILATYSDGSGADGSGFGVFAQVLSLNGTAYLPPACFLAGTLIRTPAGETAVEKLAIGDRVMTADGRALPVKFIGRQTIASRFADALTTYPICIAAGALGDNLPARDLYTSPGHAMLVDGILILAGALVDGASIRQMARPPQRFTYFHIELDEHAVVFAEGAATETFCDNVPRAIFDNASDFAALYPDARPIVQLDLPTAKSARQVPATIRRRLAARAAAIGAAGDEVAAA